MTQTTKEFRSLRDTCYQVKERWFDFPLSYDPQHGTVGWYALKDGAPQWLVDLCQRHGERVVGSVLGEIAYCDLFRATYDAGLAVDVVLTLADNTLGKDI